MQVLGPLDPASLRGIWSIGSLGRRHNVLADGDVGHWDPLGVSGQQRLDVTRGENGPAVHFHNYVT